MTNYDHLPPIPTSHGIYIMSFSIAFFSFLSFQIKRFTRSKLSKNYKKENTFFSNIINNDSHADDGVIKNNGSSTQDVRHRQIKTNTQNDTKKDLSIQAIDINEGDTWKWRNLFISWTHALVVGLWDLTSFYYYPELMSDLVFYNNLYIYCLVSFSTGYFIYDLFAIVWRRRMDKMLEVVPHHVAVVTAFTYNVTNSFSISYCVVALLTEINTVFLHSRKLMQMHGFSFSHWLYRLNSFFNMFTFITCRFGALVWIIFGVYHDFPRLPTIYGYFISFALLVLVITNILLFWRLFKSDVIRPIMGCCSKGSRVDKDCVPQEGKLKEDSRGVSGGDVMRRNNGCMPNGDVGKDA